MTRAALLLLVSLLSSCVVSTIDAPDGMTAEEAKQIVLAQEEATVEQIKEDGAARGLILSNLQVTDLYFTHLYHGSDPETGASRWERRLVPFDSLGELRIGYSWNNLFTPLLGFLVGPTLLELQDTADQVSFASYDTETTWKSLIPLWLVGASFWLSSDTERYAEALAVLRDLARSRR